MLLAAEGFKRKKEKGRRRLRYEVRERERDTVEAGRRRWRSSGRHQGLPELPDIVPL